MTFSTLEETLDFMSNLYPREGWAYSSPERLVLAHGQRFEMKPRPDDVEPGPLGYCYANAHEVAASRPEFVYCEGFAVGILGWPLQHAWLFDTRDGKAFDVTWLTEHEPHEYMGVQVPLEHMMAVTAYTGLYSVLSAEATLRELWPHASLADAHDVSNDGAITPVRTDRPATTPEEGNA